MHSSNNRRKKLLFSGVAMSFVAAIAAAALMTTPIISEAYNGFPNYANLVSVTKAQEPKLLKSTVYTEAKIPQQPDAFIKSNLVYAYGWVDTNTGKGLAATIHPNFRDSTKNPDHWHMHPVVLGKGTTTSTYCVEAFIDGLSTAEGGVALGEKSMTINVNSSKASVTADEVDTVASMIMLKDAGCPEIPKLIDGEHTIIRLGAIVHDTV
ncbi:hypothetical protein [Nitrososphaera viennensis]|uniref:Uncharacterized protein n=2 Tax=Nitrososphaera viennensis TaxID=1034015 RepID=A0A060HHY1_9ARCH|nr:hypothetical protein [Nitrososphaera viennensis]AIC16204.1 exported protein of unknown function [Nitrososphaera viennensis EN76]UVS68151.1 hypothetical protein NWT39_09595 [Nitrososphaera viennensis]